jgi:hypothetical protein
LARCFNFPGIPSLYPRYLFVDAFQIRSPESLLGALSYFPEHLNYILPNQPIPLCGRLPAPVSLFGALFHFFEHLIQHPIVISPTRLGDGIPDPVSKSRASSLCLCTASHAHVPLLVPPPVPSIFKSPELIPAQSRTVADGYNMGRKYFMKAPDAETCQKASRIL